MEDFTLFTHMIHPETGERIPINTLETKRLLRQYVSQKYLEFGIIII